MDYCCLSDHHNPGCPSFLVGRGSRGTITGWAGRVFLYAAAVTETLASVRRGIREVTGACGNVTSNGIVFAWSIMTEEPRSTNMEVSRWTKLENSISLRPHIRLMIGRYERRRRSNRSIAWREARAVLLLRESRRHTTSTTSTLHVCCTHHILQKPEPRARERQRSTRKRKSKEY